MEDNLLICIQHIQAASQYITMVRKYKARKRQQYRRWWVKPHNYPSNREVYGAYANLFTYFKLSDHEEFFKFTRMSVPQFNLLLSMVKKRLTKVSNRESLSAEFRLTATLSFLAHGDSIKTTSWFYRIGKSTMYNLIPEVCKVIWEILQPIYLRQPEVEDWIEISKGFEELWNYPNCLGAIDGKHCRIWAPPNSGSMFHNYKGYFSCVLMAACDARYRFTWVDIGDYGSLNDAGILSTCSMGKALNEDSIALPEGQRLPKTNIVAPFAFVGDEGFPLKTYLMRPYARRNVLSEEQKIFNYRLTRARRIIENSFGILVSRWAVLQTSIRLKLQTAESIIQATICLHNFLITTGIEQGHTQRYFNSKFVDQEGPNGIVVEGEWRQHNVADGVLHRIGRAGANNGPGAAMEQRDMLARYFTSNVGAVPWQRDHI